MRRIFIIVGMHRSGTSLTAQLCQCMGAYLGEEHDLIAAASENPDGHFENLQIVQINNEILRFCNRDWYSLEKPELDDSAPQIKNAAENIKTVIQKLLEKKRYGVCERSKNIRSVTLMGQGFERVKCGSPLYMGI